MARRDALLRLHKSLMARRDELLRRLGGDFGELRRTEPGESLGDSADQAFDSGSEEITSQLVELESRELAQIEKALARLRQGTYGLCEVCGRKIPVARLNALPFSTTCVRCQAELERSGESIQELRDRWEIVNDSDEENADMDVSKLELDLTR